MDRAIAADTIEPANKGSNRNSPQDDSRRTQFDRVRLLNEELDRLTTDAAERSASVMNKASFLAVSAGVIIAASTVHLWTKWPLFGVTALTFSCMALTAAAIAVRPGKRIGIQARRLVDRYADSTSSAAQVEAQIILDKANAITFREDDLRARALWVSRGFAALSIASVALTVAFTAEVLRS